MCIVFAVDGPVLCVGYGGRGEVLRVSDGQGWISTRNTLCGETSMVLKNYSSIIITSSRLLEDFPSEIYIVQLNILKKVYHIEYIMCILYL